MFKYFVAALVATVANAAGLTDYSQNGANWVGTCATGQEQSPIDLKDAKVSERLKLSNFKNYGDSETAVVQWKGKTYYADWTQGGFSKTPAEEDGAVQNFTPLQFHIHMPSEHSVNGELFDMELHIVHKQADGSLGVFGVFFDRDARSETNPFIDTWAKLVPRAEGSDDKVSILPV